MNFDLELAYPGQVQLESNYGYPQPVFDRGRGVWRGRVTIAEEIIGKAGARALETWLFQMEGSVHVSDFPLHRRRMGTLTSGTDVSLGATTALATVSGVEVAQVALSGLGAAGDLAKGDFIQIGTQTWMLNSDSTASAVDLLPAVLPTASSGATVKWETAADDDSSDPVALRARILGIEAAAYGNSFYGPVTVEVEAIA